MASPDAKKVGALVVDALPPPDKLSSMDDGGDEGGADPGVAAMRDFFASGKRGDFAAAWSALQDAVAMADKDDTKPAG